MNKRGRIKRQIIKSLYFNKECSSTEISILLNKSVPFVNGILTELVEENIVETNGLAISNGGRRPTIYRLRSDLIYILAVSVDQYETKMAIYNMQNEMVGDVYAYEYQLTHGSNDDLIHLAEGIERFISQHVVSHDKILGIGIGMPGFVDVNKNINHTFFATTRKSVVHYLEEKLHIPVLIDNDSSLVALAELQFGQAKSLRNVMVINLSWGIGLGMILEQSLFRGNKGYAGEFSHIPLYNNNRLCQCGKTGCLETEASLLILIQKAVKILQSMNQEDDLIGGGRSEVVQLQKIIEEVKSGRMEFIQLIKEIGYTIGRGISILMHLLNPSAVIISGRGRAFGKIWIAPIQQALNEHCIPKIAENIKIVISDLRDDPGLMGAAALVMDKYDNLSKLEAKASIIQ